MKHKFLNDSKSFQLINIPESVLWDIFPPSYVNFYYRLDIASSFYGHCRNVSSVSSVIRSHSYTGVTRFVVVVVVVVVLVVVAVAATVAILIFDTQVTGHRHKLA